MYGQRPPEGDVWEAQTSSDNPRYFLRIHLDDPSLPGLLPAALFPSDGGDKARLVWNRRRER
ncbi:MAG: DUF736 domain-containing protein [Notoacmeibacter sp.]|nr:DUF736 domain-containing protein [Notoacmeibacter sp.]